MHSDLFHFLPVWSLLSPQKAGPGLFRLEKVEGRKQKWIEDYTFPGNVAPESLKKLLELGGHHLLESVTLCRQTGWKDPGSGRLVRGHRLLLSWHSEMLTARYSLSNRIHTG